MRELRAVRLAELGRVRHCPIKAQPFQVERFGVAFTPPWDGSYDT